MNASKAHPAAQAAAPKKPKTKNHRAGLDDADRAILDLLQEDASRNNVKLSKALTARDFDLGPAACGQRRDRLRKLGYIEAITAIVNPAKLGSSQICFLIVKMDDRTEAAIEKLLDVAIAEPNVIEIFEMQGLCDFLMKVRVSDVGGATNLSKRLRMGIAQVDSYSVGNVPKLTRRVNVSGS
jgi:Lrp/AsnC family leucine-responsive transcriptional regulator